ncbi:Right handed beta helix region [Anaerocolumna jejuensis DSM 15929]|uniref:Right handed beta helix region n=2 Tax=Anaerocolumna TaxID=1843210 RepID=A0A1M7BF21_9FIRM|nr:Right handed beta helix region [Anaerocolumna jejuensis DSM 15929]
MVIEDNIINGCGTYGIEAAKEVKGSVTIKENKITNIKLDKIQNNASKNLKFSAK